MGSEGNFGIISEAFLRIRLQPEAKEHDEIIFPSFEQGLKFCEALVKTRILPTFFRFIDEHMVRAARTMKPEATFFGGILNSVGDFYLKSIKSFDYDKMTAAIIVFEGSQEEVQRQKTAVHNLYGNFAGVRLGSAIGERGHSLIFL